MSTLQLTERALAVQLAQVGAKHPRALAKVAMENNLTVEEALDLAMTHCQPQKLVELLAKRLKVEQICVIYGVIEHHTSTTKTGSVMRPSIRKLSDFGIWFLGTGFSEEELLEAIETARRIFPSHWTKSDDLGAEISYALGYGQALKEHSIEHIEALEIEEYDRRQLIQIGCAEEVHDFSDHGQGDVP